MLGSSHVEMVPVYQRNKDATDSLTALTTVMKQIAHQLVSFLSSLFVCLFSVQCIQYKSNS